ncbi:putative DNA repair protein [Teladorsagia circumcincta]|uniref:Putative DNA repair protein n=1 Tax=Teladorsagia circumcincta TaxID=45464 RepID=A0A2G9U006_TELCI|nr:putative DNA repair protein [Teladorsagia circumcincta]
MATDMNIEDDLFFVHDDELEEDTKKEEEETSQRPPPANDTLVDNIGKTTDEHEDILRILVASDIHVGYGENKPNLYLDSVNTFEEVLKIATEKKVDMVLLGGDLFHENNPSRDMQHRVIQLLRQYCLNDREVALEFVSDASVNFEHSRFDRVNYEDANINVGLPIFTIHGNHDDTAGKGLTILDVLHEAGLVNLFGKFSDIDQFDVKGRKFQCKPIPLQTVRPMVVDEIILDSLPEGVRLPANGVRPSGGGFVLDEMIIDDKISEMIRWAESNRGPQQPKLPLIRLKVTYAGPWAIMQPIHGRQIGAKFEDRAANAAEMVVTRRAARDSMMSKLKQMPAPEIEFDKFGNLKSDNFEMMVRNDLNVLKRQTYGIQGTTIAPRDEFDDEMEDGD